MNDKTLINWGSYDVDNFGDLLFPFLVEHYLGHKYSKIIHTSPTGKKSRWTDTIPTCTITEALTDENIEGLVVGGGNLISLTKSSSINYVENIDFAKIVHPSFFYVPYALRAKYGIPFAFNFIGVAKPIPIEKHEMVKIAVDSASFISCRDKAGANHLLNCGVSFPISIGLDSAIDISHVFSGEYLKYYFYSNNIQAKYGIPMNKPIAIIHIKKRYFKNQFIELSLLLSFLRRNHIHPVFIPFGMCHEDELVFNETFFQGQTATIIRNPKLIIDILSIISLSAYYIGSSLHGAIASLSYGKKIVIVADEVESKFSKFSGFLSQVDRVECLFKTWKDALIGIEEKGLAIFKSLSISKMKEINIRENTWESIYKYLHEAKKENININQSDNTAQSILKYYFN